RGLLRRVVLAAYRPAAALVRDRVAAPLSAAWDAVRYRSPRDVDALTLPARGDVDSLERMATTIARNRGAGPVEIGQVARAARIGEISPILFNYEEQMRHPVWSAVSGGLAQSLLVQIQKTKVDLELVLASLDRLLRANEMQFSVLAVGPVVLVAYNVAGRVAHTVWGWAAAAASRALDSAAALYSGVSAADDSDTASLMSSSSSASTAPSSLSAADSAAAAAAAMAPWGLAPPRVRTRRQAHELIRTSLREVERLLNRVDSPRAVLQAGSGDRLTTVELGLLVCELQALRACAPHVPPALQDAFLEDLDELADPFWSVRQRLATCRRMYRTYPFLWAAALGRAHIAGFFDTDG
ncbi:Nuclear control of ATPase protein 2, partial [Cladochytrium tenue]